jgi:hypothetical protein
MNIGGLFKSLINPATLMQLAMGPAGWASIIVKQLAMAVAQQVIQQLGQRLGLPQGIIDLGQQAVAAATGSQGSPMTVAGAVGQMGASLGLSALEQGQATRELDNNIEQMVNQAVRDKIGFQDEDGQVSNGKSSGGKNDFFMRFARMMGEKLNQGFKDLEAKSNATNWKDTKAVSEFQGEQQKFGMFMNAASTAIKTVGEALANMARKQ